MRALNHFVSTYSVLCCIKLRTCPYNKDPSSSNVWLSCLRPHVNVRGLCVLKPACVFILSLVFLCVCVLSHNSSYKYAPLDLVLFTTTSMTVLLLHTSIKAIISQLTVSPSGCLWFLLAFTMINLLQFICRCTVSIRSHTTSHCPDNLSDQHSYAWNSDRCLNLIKYKGTQNTPYHRPSRSCRQFCMPHVQTLRLIVVISRAVTGVSSDPITCSACWSYSWRSSTGITLCQILIDQHVATRVSLVSVFSNERHQLYALICLTHRLPPSRPT